MSGARLGGGVGVHLRGVVNRLPWESQRPGIAYLALATSQRDVDETASVRESLLRAALTVRLSI